MDQDFKAQSEDRISVIRTQLHVSSSWINQQLAERNIQIPLSKKHHLTAICFGFYPGQINMQGDIVEKAGSIVELMFSPIWDADAQTMKLNDLRIRVRSKNILVKGAGWFTKTFLHSRMDKKVEQAVNQQYRQMILALKEKPLSFPLIPGSQLQGHLHSLTLHSLKVEDNRMLLDVEVIGRIEVSMI